MKATHPQVFFTYHSHISHTGHLICGPSEICSYKRYLYSKQTALCQYDSSSWLNVSLLKQPKFDWIIPKHVICFPTNHLVSLADETCKQHRMSNCMGHLNQTKTNEGKTVLQWGIIGSHCYIIECCITKEQNSQAHCCKIPKTCVSNTYFTINGPISITTQLCCVTTEHVDYLTR
jgi:hypothetical protein